MRSDARDGAVYAACYGLVYPYLGALDKLAGGRVHYNLVALRHVVWHLEGEACLHDSQFVAATHWGERLSGGRREAGRR